MVTLPIIEVKQETPLHKTFFFELDKHVEPGQFFMLWVPGVDEVPMCVSSYKNGIIGFTVRKVGEATEAMHKLHVGDVVGLRGPFGNSFKLIGFTK